MFITHEEHKAPLLSPFGGGLMHWQAAELALQRPWFLVSVSQSDTKFGDDSFRASRTMLISNIADVEDLAQTDAASQMQLDGVFIVTPAHVNGTNRWKMEALRAVWRAEEPSVPGQLTDVYETAEGVTYADSMLDTPAAQLQKKILHCTFPLQQ